MKSKSKTIINIPETGWDLHREPTPVGEILVLEFLEPLGLTQTELARAVHCDVKTINRLCNNKCALSPLLAVKLARYFSNSPEFWMGFQIAKDIYEAKKLDVKMLA